MPSKVDNKGRAGKAAGKAPTKAEKSSKGERSSKSGKASGKAAGAAVAADEPKRKLGLRGAAPWAARHAAKHAAEARARAAEPPPPGSARATIRTPSGAEEIKAKVSELHNLMQQIRAARKNVNKGFYEVGVVLRDIQARKLYEAKGFGSFDTFLERELDLSKSICLKLVRAAGLLQREAALELGMDKVMNGLAAFDAAIDPQAGGISTPSNVPTTPKLILPLKPPTSRIV